MVRVLCALPSYDGFVRAETAASVANLQVPPWATVEVKAFSGYGIADARNKMAKEALNGGYSHLLMVDSDIVPPEDGLVKLLDSGKDFIVGYYPRSNGDGDETCMFKYGDNYRSPFTVSELEGALTRNPVEIRGAGLGFALVSTSVFTRLREPWFHHRFDSKSIGTSEDLWFCNSCRDKGIRIFADPAVRCGHLVTRQL